MLFVSSKTAKYAEILTAVILSHTFFDGTNLYVGDKEKVTDIYTKSRDIGIEVVQAEYLCDFLLDSYSKLSLRQGLSLDPVNNKKTKARVLSWSYNTNLDDKYVMEQFRARVKDKLFKLNNGNYKKIKGEIDLALLSYMRVKDRVDANNFIKVYKEECCHYQKTFDKVFLIFSSGIYYIIDGDIVAQAEFVGDEFLSYQMIAKELMADIKKQA